MCSALFSACSWPAACLRGRRGFSCSGYYNAARDDIGDSLLLPAITVVVLGGVDIFGGKGG